MYIYLEASPIVFNVGYSQEKLYLTDCYNRPENIMWKGILSAFLKISPHTVE